MLAHDPASLEWQPHVPEAASGIRLGDVLLGRGSGECPGLGTQIWLWPVKGLHFIWKVKELGR